MNLSGPGFSMKVFSPSLCYKAERKGIPLCSWTPSRHSLGLQFNDTGPPHWGGEWEEMGVGGVVS